MQKRERERKRKEMRVSLLPLMVPALYTNEDLRATEYKNVLMLNKYGTWKQVWLYTQMTTCYTAC